MESGQGRSGWLIGRWWAEDGGLVGGCHPLIGRTPRRLRPRPHTACTGSASSSFALPGRARAPLPLPLPPPLLPISPEATASIDWFVSSVLLVFFSFLFFFERADDGELFLSMNNSLNVRRLLTHLFRLEGVGRGLRPTNDNQLSWMNEIIVSLKQQPIFTVNLISSLFCCCLESIHYVDRRIVLHDSFYSIILTRCYFRMEIDDDDRNRCRIGAQ